MEKLHTGNFFRGPPESASRTPKGPRNPLWEPLDKAKGFKNLISLLCASKIILDSE